MCAVNHKIRIIIHLIIEHHNWIEDASIKDEVKKAKETVQRVLKPGGGDGTASRIGVAYGFPDAKVCCLLHRILYLKMTINFHSGVWRHHNYR